MNISEMQVKIKEGDHLCSIYATLEQQFSILSPFILHGLEKGEKCIYVLDEHTTENVTSYFLEHGVDLEPYLQSGAFIFLSKEETYLKDGLFDPDHTINLIKAILQNALDEGYNGLRSTGEMTWVFSKFPGVDRLMEYEAKLNHFLPGKKLTLICQYNEHKFEPAVLLDVLRTHPKVILYGNYYDNNVYEPPDIFLARLEGKITRDMYLSALDMIMQRKKMDETLRENELKYRLLFEETLSPIMLVEKTGNFVDANQAALNFLEISREELYKKQVFDWAPPDLLEQQKREHTPFFKARTLETEYLVHGKIKTLLLNVVPINISGRKFLYVMGQDITERKQAEQETSKAHQRLLTVLDSIEALVYVMDLKTHELLFINLFGRNVFSGVVGEKCWQTLQAGQTGPCDFCPNDQMLDPAGQPTGVYHWEFIAKNGRWYDCRDIALRWVNGRMVKLGTGTDITELKQLQEILQKERNEVVQTLHATEKEYQFLVNNVNEAIVVAQDSLYKYANPMALKLFNCTMDELTAKPFINFIHPDDRDMVKSRHKKRLKGEDVIKRYAYRIKPADGTTKWVEVSSVAIKWEGRPASLTLISDITERRIMEEEIFKADKLESIGILAGGIAHDFNNYLAALLGNTSLAKLYTDNPQKVQEKLESIERATLRAQDLSNQLFAFAKGAKPVKKTVSLKQIIMDNINFTLSGSNISCDYAIAKNLHLVEIDEAQFSQVLNNIVLNAVQAMPEGGTIGVTAENVITRAGSEASILPLPAGNYIKISIEDQGIGIPQKHLQKIFDPFFTTKQKGSGLGLATSYTIMHNHGGHISVTSKTGVGTTFHLYLPASTQPRTTANPPGNIFYGTGKILVMDDQEDYLAVTVESLSTFGYKASLARDGREAITIYMDALKKGQPFDLVIMDLTVPGGMGGKDTIKELLQKDPAVKAIVASGYSNDPVMANFQEYGFKGVIKKPFTMAELSKLIHELMG